MGTGDRRWEPRCGQGDAKTERSKHPRLTHENSILVDDPNATRGRHYQGG